MLAGDRAAWERIASVFDRALTAGGAERGALLDWLCGADATVRREVEAMRAAHDGTGALLAERRLVTGGATVPAGARVGAYRVLSPIGAGGMGEVYRAERADDAYRQAVALKVLRPGWRTAEMVRRFRIARAGRRGSRWRSPSRRRGTRTRRRRTSARWWTALVRAPPLPPRRASCEGRALRG